LFLEGRETEPSAECPGPPAPRRSVNGRSVLTATTPPPHRSHEGGPSGPSGGSPSGSGGKPPLPAGRPSPGPLAPAPPSPRCRSGTGPPSARLSVVCVAGPERVRSRVCGVRSPGDGPRTQAYHGRIEHRIRPPESTPAKEPSRRREKDEVSKLGVLLPCSVLSVTTSGCRLSGHGLTQASAHVHESELVRVEHPCDDGRQ